MGPRKALEEGTTGQFQVSQGTLGKKPVCAIDTYVSCVPKKKMGYLLGGGFTAPSAMSSICSERRVVRGLQVRAGYSGEKLTLDIHNTFQTQVWRAQLKFTKPAP